MNRAHRQHAEAAPDLLTKETEPFRSADEAWFWTMSALSARRAGAQYNPGLGRIARPCEPDDIIKCLERLYRRRRIDLVHARTLRIWGERGAAPSPVHPAEHANFVLWREAMSRLEGLLRIKGIVR